MKKRKKRTAAPTGPSFIRSSHGAGRVQTRKTIVDGKVVEVKVESGGRVDMIPPDEMTELPVRQPEPSGPAARGATGPQPEPPRDAAKRFVPGEAMSEFSREAGKKSAEARAGQKENRKIVEALGAKAGAALTEREAQLANDAGLKSIAHFEKVGGEPLDESSKGFLMTAAILSALATKALAAGNVAEARKNNQESRANVAIVSENVARSTRARGVEMVADGDPEIPPIEYFDLKGNVVPHDEVLVFPPNCEPTQFGRSVGLSMMFRARQDSVEGSPVVTPAVPHLLFGKAPAMPAPAFDAEDLERRLQEDRERQEANEARYRIEKAAMAAAERRQADEDEKATAVREDPLDPTKKRRQR